MRLMSSRGKLKDMRKSIGKTEEHWMNKVEKKRDQISSMRELLNSLKQKLEKKKETLIIMKSKKVMLNKK